MFIREIDGIRVGITLSCSCVATRGDVWRSSVEVDLILDRIDS